MFASTTSAFLGLGLLCSGFTQVAAATDPFVQLFIDQNCEDQKKDGKKEYILYTNPQNTNKCITFGAPGFPFFSTQAGAVQCGDYTDGGAKSGPCNTYPKNAPAVSAGGDNFKCTFWTSEDCGIHGHDEVFIELTVKPDGTAGCQDFPPQLPLSGGNKQTASSMSCKPL